MDSHNKLVDEAEAALAAGELMEWGEASEMMKLIKNADYSYDFFWNSLSPKAQMGGKIPPADHDLTLLVSKSFGSYQNLFTHFHRESVKIHDMDWAWLVYNEKTDKLEHRQTKRMDMPSDF